MTTPPGLSFQNMLQHIESGALEEEKNTHRDERDTHSTAYGIESMLATFEKLYGQIVLVNVLDAEDESWQLAWLVSFLTTIDHALNFEVKLMSTGDFKRVPVHCVLYQARAQRITDQDSTEVTKARVTKKIKKGSAASRKKTKALACVSSSLYQVTFANIVVHPENGVRAKTLLRCMPKGYVPKLLW